MRFLLVLLVLISVISVSDAYQVDPLEWSAYQSAVAAAGMVEQTPNVARVYPASIFAMEFDFTASCALSESNSAARSSIDAVGASFGCVIKEWYGIDCISIVTIRCGNIPSMTALIANSPIIQQYGEKVYHWWKISYDGIEERSRPPASSSPSPPSSSSSKPKSVQSNDTDTQGKRAPTIYQYPGAFDAQYCFDDNANSGYNVGPRCSTPNWHLSTILRASGSTTPQSYPWNVKGRIYIADSGIDSQHPEFIDPQTGLSRVEDRAFHQWVDPNAEPWMDNFQDEEGHGTNVAGFAAGNTLGACPNAEIINLKFWVSNVYDCLNLPASAFWPNIPPTGYPFIDECGTFGYAYAAFVNAALWSRTDAYHHRVNSPVPQPSVFVSSSAPRWVVSWDGPIVDCTSVNCMGNVIFAFQKLISAGVIVVLPIGNDGWNIDTDANLQAMGVYAPYLFSIPDIVIVGGSDIMNQQAIYDKYGWDDTGYFCDSIPSWTFPFTPVALFTGASSWGPIVDYYAPATCFSSYAMTNRIRHRSNTYVPPYWHNNLASGTSFAAPLVAGGILSFQMTLPASIISGNPLPITWQRLNQVSNVVTSTYQMFDDYLYPLNPWDPNRPPSHIGLNWGDWVPTAQNLKIFQVPHPFP